MSVLCPKLCMYFGLDTQLVGSGILVPFPGTEPAPSAVKAQSYHGTTREVPVPILTLEWLSPWRVSRVFLPSSESGYPGLLSAGSLRSLLFAGRGSPYIQMFLPLTLGDMRLIGGK